MSCPDIQRQGLRCNGAWFMRVHRRPQLVAWWRDAPLWNPCIRRDYLPYCLKAGLCCAAQVLHVYNMFWKRARMTPEVMNDTVTYLWPLEAD